MRRCPRPVQIKLMNSHSRILLSFMLIQVNNIYGITAIMVRIYPELAFEQITVETSYPHRHLIDIISLNGQLLYPD